MSSKWRSLQHRHKYTYSSVVFPELYLHTSSFDSAGCSSCSAVTDFYSQLRHLASLTSTYLQVTAVKDLADSFCRLLASHEVPEDAIATATRLYLKILFLDDSLPLHRTLISVLAKCKKWFSLIANCFASLCEEFGNAGSGERTNFLVSRAALSLIGYPKMGFLDDAVKSCADIVAADVVDGLGGVLSDVEKGLRPSPVMMEHCQDAMSCLYYLLQRYPSRFVELQEAYDVFKNVIRTILCVLRSTAFSRDCLVASGVSFCAAIQVFMTSEDVFRFISRRLFGYHALSYASDCDLGKNLLDNEDIIREIGDLSELSRLCLLRGILTAMPRNLLSMRVRNASDGSFWTILYDGVLLELCKYCENPVDSHFNFHALTVTQICLQQIKTSIFAGLTDFSDGYQPIAGDTINRLLRIIWNNLDDPLSQTVKQVHLIVDLLLDVECSLLSDNKGRSKSFLCEIAADLLHLGPGHKGRYVPLASLTKRLGAKSLFNLNHKILFEAFFAYIDDDVCCAVTSFLKCFLEHLRDECWRDAGVDKGYEEFREICLPPLMNGLVSAHSKLRSNLNTYAVPVVIDVDRDSIFWMLDFISVGPTVEVSMKSDELNLNNSIAAMVSLLKVARILALVEGDIDLDPLHSSHHKDSEGVAVLAIRGRPIRVPVAWFYAALTHSEDSLRIDAAEALFLNPKTASLPSLLELSLLKYAVPLNMRCSSTAFQMKWTSLFRKIFSRVRTALERQVKLGVWSPCNGYKNNTDELLISRTENLYNFIKWLGCFLFNSCYPSGPYERKTMAMELILTLLDTWPISHHDKNIELYPYKDAILSPDHTLSFAGSIIDSWDKLRESSFRILSHFPTPLPGICTKASLNGFMRWTKELITSPRVRESDAGSLALRLIFKKYVVELGNAFVFSEATGCLQCDDNLPDDNQLLESSQNSVVLYISSLIEWLAAAVEEGERDLTEACQNSFVHGILLTLRYTFEELDWNSRTVQSCISSMRMLIGKLLQLIVRVTSVALWVVSADAWYMPCDVDDIVDDTFLLDDIVEDDQVEAANYAEKEMKSGSGNKPDRVLLVGCWLAMKEVSLLFGTIIRKIPLPGCSRLNSWQDISSSSEERSEQDGPHGDILDLSQLETMGNHFLEILLKMKHNGAIDKTRAGFSALCNRLLCSNDPRLCKMTESWMELLMARTVAKGQTVDDLLRRSAGIPAAFVAFFLAEPEGTPKKLLPRALEWLIGIAKGSSIDSCQYSDLVDKMTNKEVIVAPNDVPVVHVNGSASKVRDEGVVPTVHAFNVLRAAFNDTNLAADTSGFCAEAMIVSIRAFSSPYWEVRNGACLAYTALVRRMIGFFNVQKRESARRSLTGLEFFHRFPALHPFLSEELKIATQSLDGSSARVESNIAKAIHPSLCPILILLSRLKPSLISSAVDDALDPFSLMPFIQRCATQSNLRIRVLSSRALTGLVSNEKLQDVLKDISQNLLSCGPDSAAAIDGNGKSTRPRLNASSNLIHGLLLQLSSLLDCNCRSLIDAAKRDQILEQMIRVLVKCSWLGSMITCRCPLLITSYIKVLDLMLDVARTNASKLMSDISEMLFQLTSHFLNTRVSQEFVFHDPTREELLQQAAVSYFSCLQLSEGSIQGVEDGIQMQKLNVRKSDTSVVTLVSLAELNEQIISCVSDPSYELRAVTLKRLLRFVKSVNTTEQGILFRWASSHLQDVMVDRLIKEDSPKCVYYILKIIFLWNTRTRESSSIQRSVLSSEVWSRLNELNAGMSQSKTREAVLCCMAVYVRQFTRSISNTVSVGLEDEPTTSVIEADRGNSLSYVDSFNSLVKIYSAQSQPVNMRRAAAEAIIASNLLEDAMYFASSLPSSFRASLGACNGDALLLRGCALKILDLWFICIQLLEDEDSNIRERLANYIQRVVTRVPDGAVVEIVAPMQVDRVNQLCFEYLSSVFGHRLEYLDYLLKLLLDAGGSLSTRENLVRQIFEKEIDNHHEEKLLICQICCMNVDRILQSYESDSRQQTCGDIEAFLGDRCRRYMHQLSSLAGSLCNNAGLSDWICGLGNHKDTFLPVYANLLALHTLTKNRAGNQLDGEFIAEMLDLGPSVAPFLRNPLISSLYSMLLQACGISGLRVEHENFLDGFEPYFLLR